MFLGFNNGLCVQWTRIQSGKVSGNSSNNMGSLPTSFQSGGFIVLATTTVAAFIISTYSITLSTFGFSVRNVSNTTYDTILEFCAIGN